MATASLHVVTSDARRGAETFAVELAAGLSEVGHRAQVAALSPSGMAEAHDLPTLGATRRSVGTFRALRGVAGQADVVVAHGSATLEACAVGLVGTGVPFVYRTIGDPSYWVNSGWRRRGIGWMLRRAARTVVLWEAAGQYLASTYKIPAASIDVVPNAVMAERFQVKDAKVRARARSHCGLPTDKPCLAFVGALSAEKDVSTLLEALRQLDDVHLVIAGDGPERQRLTTLGDQYAPGRVHILGVTTDPRDVYAAADLLVLPSLSEGMPAVIIEAGLVGTPAIASSVGAVPVMIDDGTTGFLIPPGRPDVLAATVERVLPWAADVGRRARAAFSERYKMENVVWRWAAILEEVRDGDSAGRRAHHRRRR